MITQLNDNIRIVGDIVKVDGLLVGTNVTIERQNPKMNSVQPLYKGSIINNKYKGNCTLYQYTDEGILLAEYTGYITENFDFRGSVHVYTNDGVEHSIILVAKIRDKLVAIIFKDTTMKLIVDFSYRDMSGDTYVVKGDNIVYTGYSNAYGFNNVGNIYSNGRLVISGYFQDNVFQVGYALIGDKVKALFDGKSEDRGSIIDYPNLLKILNVGPHIALYEQYCIQVKERWDTLDNQIKGAYSNE